MELLASGHRKARGWGADTFYAVHSNNSPIAVALVWLLLVYRSAVTDPAQRQNQEVFQSAAFTIHVDLVT